MNEILNYLKECNTFYLATTEGGRPHVRPFGAVCEFEGKLYIVTNNKKKVYRQMLENPNIEISGMVNGTWIRVEGKAIHDTRREARAAMISENEAALGSMYNADDNLMEVLYLEDVTAAIYSFTAEPKIIAL